MAREERGGRGYVAVSTTEESGCEGGKGEGEDLQGLQGRSHEGSGVARKKMGVEAKFKGARARERETRTYLDVAPAIAPYK